MNALLAVIISVATASGNNTVKPEAAVSPRELMEFSKAVNTETTLPANSGIRTAAKHQPTRTELVPSLGGAEAPSPRVGQRQAGSKRAASGKNAATPAPTVLEGWRGRSGSVRSRRSAHRRASRQVTGPRGAMPNHKGRAGATTKGKTYKGHAGATRGKTPGKRLHTGRGLEHRSSNGAARSGKGPVLVPVLGPQQAPAQGGRIEAAPVVPKLGGPSMSEFPTYPQPSW